MKELSVVIPVRENGSPEITLRSLGRQTYQDFEVVISQDDHRNANWARNRGYEMSSSPFLLFSDDDIQWRPDALDIMMTTLRATPKAAYVYGTYLMGGKTYCNQPFDAQLLRKRNYISTMSIIRRGKFLGFDESLERLQDWDLWLRLLRQGEFGVHCGSIIFTTEVKDGITYGGRISYQEAAIAVLSKGKSL